MNGYFLACDRKLDFTQLGRSAHTQKNVACSLCLYVYMYWPEIFCLKAVIVACSLSACMYVLDFQDQHTLLK